MNYRNYIDHLKEKHLVKLDEHPLRKNKNARIYKDIDDLVEKLPNLKFVQEYLDFLSHVEYLLIDTKDQQFEFYGIYSFIEKNGHKISLLVDEGFFVFGNGLLFSGQSTLGQKYAFKMAELKSKQSIYKSTFELHRPEKIEWEEAFINFNSYLDLIIKQ